MRDMNMLTEYREHPNRNPARSVIVPRIRRRIHYTLTCDS